MEYYFKSLSLEEIQLAHNLIQKKLNDLELKWLSLKRKGDWKHNLSEIKELKEKIDIFRLCEKETIRNIDDRLEGVKLEKVEVLLKCVLGDSMKVKGGDSSPEYAHLL